MLNKTKNTSFPWRHPSICTPIDHGQRPITARVAFTSLYNRVQINGWRYGKLFSLFSSKWRAVFKMFAMLLRNKQAKAPKTLSRSYSRRRIMWKTETKKVLDDLKMPNLQKSSQESPACVSFCYESHSLKNVSETIELRASEGVEFFFGESAYKWNIKEEKKEKTQKVAYTWPSWYHAYVRIFCVRHVWLLQCHC